MRNFLGAVVAVVLVILILVVWDEKGWPPFDDENDNTVSAAASFADRTFGGDSDNWSEVPGSNGSGWIYSGPPTEIKVPSGYRIDYSGHTCDGSNSGVYGPVKVGDITNASVWHVPGETKCPTQAAAKTNSNGNGSSESSRTEAKASSSGSGNNAASGLSTATTCGTISWGPAGPAPGVGTSDSGAQVAEAVQVMDIPLDDAEHVTIHKYCPGDDTPNGWVVGSSWTESRGVKVSANFLPAGVCIDYDHNVTRIEGDVHHTQVLNPRWSRTQITSDGSATGLKFTVYWTPCVFTDGTKSWEGSGVKSDTTDSRTSSTCPSSANDAAAMYGGLSSNWTKHPQYGNGWIYQGPVIPGFAVPGGGKVDYDGGSLESGSVPSGSAFTAWCPK